METWEELRKGLEQEELGREDQQREPERDRNRTQRLGWHRREKPELVTPETDDALPVASKPRATLVASGHGRPEVRGGYQVDSARPSHRPALVEMRMLQRRLLAAVPDYLIRPLPAGLSTGTVDTRHEADLREIVDEMMASTPPEVIEAVFTWARARRAHDLVAMLREGAAMSAELQVLVAAPLARLGSEAAEVERMLSGALRNRMGEFIDKVLPYLLLADAIADDGYRDPRLR